MVWVVDDDVLEVLLEDEDVELEAKGAVLVHCADVAHAGDEGSIDEPREARRDEPSFRRAEVRGDICVEGDKVVV